MKPAHRRIAIGAALVFLPLFSIYRVVARRLPVFATSPQAHALGSFHLHSRDSHDSEVPLEDYAEAARAQGLSFIILTDHNSQRPHPLTIGDITVLSFAELSTIYGHVVGLGAARLLEGDERDAASLHDTFRKVTGSGIVTHPSDLKRPWNGPWAGVGGLEIANLASSARRAARPMFFGLFAEMLTWNLNRELTLAQLYDRDDAALARWDAQPDPGVVGMCGNDAHGWIDVGANMLAWTIAVDANVAAGDNRAASIVAALQRGRFYCVAGLFGRDPDFSFVARAGGSVVATAGDTIARGRVEQLVARGPSASYGRTDVVLLRDGVEVARTSGEPLTLERPATGTYRVEVRVKVPGLIVGTRSVPAIYSNRIRIAPLPPPPQLVPLRPPLPAGSPLP